jgi:hypothetical protein
MLFEQSVCKKHNARKILVCVQPSEHQTQAASKAPKNFPGLGKGQRTQDNKNQTVRDCATLQVARRQKN